MNISDQPRSDSTPRSRSSNRPGVVLRILLPLCLLGLGGAAFWKLSQPVEEAKSPPAESEPIRTRVAKLYREDYTVVVKTNGIVQPHNEVAISAEVAGLVKTVSPSFEVGAYFHQGDVLVELDDRDYKTAVAVAEATKLGAEASLRLAEDTYQRNLDLYEKKGVSEASLRQAFADQASASAQLDTAIAQLEQAQRDLTRTKIIAPFDGRVRNKSVGVGQSVGTGAPLGIVFAIDFAEVRLPIASRERAFLQLPESPGDPPVDVELRDAIDVTADFVWHGKILRTEGTLDADSLELFAIAQIDDPFGQTSGEPPLRIGQPVIAMIRGKTLEGVVAIPRIAVRQLDQVYFVDNNTLRSGQIEPIWADESQLIVTDPSIQDGQRIATTRIVYAPDGAEVEIIPEIELTETPSDDDAPSTVTKTVAQ